MSQMITVTFKVPEDVRDKAKSLGLNMSEIARDALCNALLNACEKSGQIANE